MGRGKSRRLVPEMRILETGLWSAHAEALWEMELRLAEKQGAEIRILAPDEPAARAAFEAAHPERVHDAPELPRQPRPARATRSTTRTPRTRTLRRRRGGRRTHVTTAAVVPAVDDGARRPRVRGLEADLRSWVRRHGIVVWLDQAGHYSGFVDRLKALRDAGALPYEVHAFRGSHLALMMALDGVAAGTEKVPLVIHLPGFTEETVRQTPLFELYAAGVRYRKALDTLVTEAAAGRVRPDQIASFKAQPGMTLAGADAWLERAPGRRRGRHRGTAPGHEADGRVSTTCSPAGFVAGRIGELDDEDALWERFAAWIGLPALLARYHAPALATRAPRTWRSPRRAGRSAWSTWTT